ncbi:MAG: putative Histidine kinase [Candidatus Saccharibacteria bacterium]|nr:putative Histidine kinase [Candidatus Saccharibacteria bacterium]
MGLISILIICVTNLALGLFVLLRDSKATFARSFMVMSVLICIWITSSFLTEYSVASLELNNLANRLSFISGYGVILAGLIFTYYFPLKRRVRRPEIAIISIISLIIVVLSGSSLVSGDVISENGSIQFTVGPLIAVYVIGFVGLLVLIGRNLLQLPRRLEASRRLQARILLFAFAVSALSGLLANVILPSFSQNWDTTQFGPFATVLLSALIVYTIARHGLFDVRLAVVRTVAYVLALLTLAVLYYLAALGISLLFLSDTNLMQPAGIALALVLAFVFQPVRRFFDQLTNKLFYKDNYNVDDFFSSLTKVLNSTTNLHRLLERSAQAIATTLKAEQVFFFVKKTTTNHHVIVGTEGFVKIASADIEAIGEYGKEHPGMILRSLLEENESIDRLLASYRLEIVMPLIQNDIVIGYLCLGEHRTSSYSRRDVKVLQAISDELLIAIQNALSVQEVQDLNATLQQRIDSATKELRVSNAQLQKLDEAKDEFISMASHQLRTPLTSIKGYISMLMDGDVGKVSREQQHLLQEVFISSERMVRLIGDFLNVSRLQTGKFIIDKHPSDLAKIVAQEVESLEPNASAHGLQFTYKRPKNIPEMNLDENKIQQVIMNFCDNAIYYSKENSKISVKLAIVNHQVEFSVKDTGIGVPEAEQAQLFDKFFRATNARKQRPDGTGVGLFLAKKVIDAHDGEIVFESKEGKGSTFGFRLPIKKH